MWGEGRGEGEGEGRSGFEPSDNKAIVLEYLPFYRNFGEICPSNGTGFFFLAPKTEMALSCII